MAATGFCPQCGTQRTGDLRFCAKCGFDFSQVEEGRTAAAVPPPPATTAGTAVATRRPWLLWAGIAIAALLVIGVISSVVGEDDPVGQTGASATATATVEVEESEEAEETPDPTERPTPEPAPDEGPFEVSVGEWVSITCGGDPCQEVRVTKPSFHDFYAGEYFNDEPEERGWQYLQVSITYESLENGTDYNPFEWAIYAGNRQLESYTYTSYGPQNTLESGTLPKGRRAEGWLIYEVPPNGKIILSYEPNFDGPPIFEVVLRR